MIRIAMFVAFLVVGCGPSNHAFQQESVVAVDFLPEPNRSNPVAFGSLLKDKPDLQAECIAMIASEVRGRLPGVRFLVLHGPVYDWQYGLADSYRVPGPDGLIVLGWIEAPDFQMRGLRWEVEHMVAGTDDAGNPIGGSR